MSEGKGYAGDEGRHFSGSKFDDGRSGSSSGISSKLADAERRDERGDRDRSRERSSGRDERSRAPRERRVGNGSEEKQTRKSSHRTKKQAAELVDNIWTKLATEAATNATSDPAASTGAVPAAGTATHVPSEGRETFVLVVGPKQSGKSTVVNLFLNPNKKDKPKPTVAMEYTFGRRSAGSGGVRDIAHIWELGGGRKLSELIRVPIDVERVTNLMVIVVVDLSSPAKAFSTAQWWIDLVRRRVRETIEELKRTRQGQKRAAALMEAARGRFPNGHPDSSSIDISPVPLVLLANKYDLFANEDPAKRRVLMSALRHLAHVNGASFYCCSTKDKTLQSYYRSLMNNKCFGVRLTRGKQLDPSKPVVVNAGGDSLEQIGAPRGGAGRADAGRAGIAAFRSAVEARDIFPSSMEDEMDAVIQDVDDKSQWLEAAIDAARADQDDRLARYRREAERRARLAGRGDGP